MIEDLVLRVRAAVDNSIKAAESALGRIYDVAIGVATALATAGIAISGFVVEAALGIRDMKRYADSIGVTTREVQELTHAFEAYGADLPDVADAINTITDRALDAVGGMQSFIDDFGLIGVKVDELRGKNPVELFELVAAKFGDTEDGAKRATAAVRLFGDDLGRKLLPMLTRGADELARLRQQAHEYGIIVGEDAASAAEDFSVKLDLLRSRVGLVAQAIGVHFLPAGQRVLAWMTKASDTVLPVVLRTIERAGRATAAALAFLETPLGNVIAGIAAFGAGVGIARAGAKLLTLAKAAPLVGTAITTMLGPVGLAILGFGALFVAADDLYTYLTSENPTDSIIGQTIEWLGITEEMNGALGSMKAAGAAVWGVIEQIGTAISEAGSAMAAEMGIMEDFEKAWERIAGWASIAMEALGTVLKLPFGFIEATAGAVEGAAKGAAENWENRIGSIREFGVAGALGEPTQSFVGPPVQSVSQTWEINLKTEGMSDAAAAKAAESVMTKQIIMAQSQGGG